MPQSSDDPGMTAFLLQFSQTLDYLRGCGIPVLFGQGRSGGHVVRKIPRAKSWEGIGLFLYPHLLSLQLSSKASFISAAGFLHPQKNGSAWLPFFYYQIFREANRSMARFVFSGVLNAVRRKYPSPAAPKPAPGVPATLASFKSLSKKLQESMPPGVFSQT